MHPHVHQQGNMYTYSADRLGLSRKRTYHDDDAAPHNSVVAAPAQLHASRRQLHAEHHHHHHHLDSYVHDARHHHHHHHAYVQHDDDPESLHARTLLYGMQYDAASCTAATHTASRLYLYMNYLTTRSRVYGREYLMALVYLNRYASVLLDHQATPGTAYTAPQRPDVCEHDQGQQYLAKLFLVCLMLATKFSLEPDECVTNAVWARIGGTTLQTVNALEQHIIEVVDYRLHVSKDEWGKWVSLLKGSRAAENLGLKGAALTSCNSVPQRLAMCVLARISRATSAPQPRQSPLTTPPAPLPVYRQPTPALPRGPTVPAAAMLMMLNTPPHSRPETPRIVVFQPAVVYRFSANTPTPPPYGFSPYNHDNCVPLAPTYSRPAKRLRCDVYATPEPSRSTTPVFQELDE